MIKDISRRRVLQLGAIGASTLAMPGILRAQTYPAQPLNIIVPFATGGYNDRLARAFGPYLDREFGQPSVIVNRPGAGAQLGHMYAMQQPMDGYSILCTSAAPYIPLSILLQGAPYTVEDFHMINLPSRDYTLAATSSDSEIETLQQAIDMLREDPSSLSIGVQPASADYVNMALTMQRAGIELAGLRVVTYDGGGPTRNAAAGGQVDIGFVGGEGFLPLKDRIRPLAIYASETVEWFPEAPTHEAAGTGGDFLEGSQRGWAVPTRLVEEQPEVYAQLSGAVERASQNPECIEALELQELATTWYGAEDSNAALRANFETTSQYADLLRG